MNYFWNGGAEGRSGSLPPSDKNKVSFFFYVFILFDLILILFYFNVLILFLSPLLNQHHSYCSIHDISPGESSA